MRVEISGVPSGLVPLKVTQPGNNQGAIHVQTLEVDFLILQDILAPIPH